MLVVILTDIVKPSPQEPVAELQFPIAVKYIDSCSLASKLGIIKDCIERRVFLTVFIVGVRLSDKKT